MNINDENMSYVFSLSKLLKINEKSFLRSLNTFKGLPHRYEIFLKRKIVFLSMILKQLLFKQLKLLWKVQKIYTGLLEVCQKKMTKLT